ncbi:MAG: hypothetical protein MK105_18050 [Crocinitomicaceae bacterium]|nr:hypothetical protein [Crocinitomicaceae bacterium]
MKPISFVLFLCIYSSIFAQADIKFATKTVWYLGDFDNLSDTITYDFKGSALKYFNEDSTKELSQGFELYPNDRKRIYKNYELDNRRMYFDYYLDSLGNKTRVDTSYYLNDSLIYNSTASKVIKTYENEHYIFTLTEHASTYVAKSKQIIIEDTSDHNDLNFYYVPAFDYYGLFYSNYDDQGRIVTSVEFDKTLLGAGNPPFCIKTWEYFEDTLGYEFVTFGYYHTFEKKQLFEIYLTEYKQELSKSEAKSINKDFDKVCKKVFSAKD